MTAAKRLCNVCDMRNTNPAAAPGGAPREPGNRPPGVPRARTIADVARELEELCPGDGPLVLCLDSDEAYDEVSGLPGARVGIIGPPSLASALSRAEAELGRVQIMALHRGCTAALHTQIVSDPAAFEREFEDPSLWDGDRVRYISRTCPRCKSTLTRTLDSKEGADAVA